MGKVHMAPWSSHVPEERLPQAVALALGVEVLEGHMHHVRLHVQLAVQPLHEESVPAAEGGHRQDAKVQLPVVATAPGAGSGFREKR
jgi:hypothetical protein